MQGEFRAPSRARARRKHRLERKQSFSGNCGRAKGASSALKDSRTCQRFLPRGVIRHDELLPLPVLGLGLQAGIQRLHGFVQKSALLLRILLHLRDAPDHMIMNIGRVVHNYVHHCSDGSHKNIILIKGSISYSEYDAHRF